MRKKAQIELPWLLLGQFINNIGMSFVWPLTTIYLHQVLGKSLTEVGVVLLLNSGANVVASTIGGRIFDRGNPYWLLLCGISVEGLAMFTLIFWHGWPIYPIMLVIMGFASGWLNTMFNALAASITMGNVRRAFNLLYLSANLGVVIGTMLVGFVYAHGMHLLFTITTVLYVLFLIMAIIEYNVDASNVTGVDPRQAGTVGIPKPNLMLIWTLFTSLFLIWLVYEQWVSNLSVYMVSQNLQLRQYSFLWTINAALLVIFQALLSAFGGWIKNQYYQYFFGVFFVGLSFLTLLFAHDYAHFIFAMVILTIGEVTWSPTVPILISQLSPLNAKGRFQGLNSAASALGRSVGPLFGGIVIDLSSYQLLFWLAFFMMMAVLLINVWMVRHYHPRTKNYLKEK